MSDTHDRVIQSLETRQRRLAGELEIWEMEGAISSGRAAWLRSEIQRLAERAASLKARQPVNEAAAAAYAAAVHGVLVEEFPNLAAPALKRIVLEEVGRQAEVAKGHFELVVDEVAVANWRLAPDHVGTEPWRVQICCCKRHPSATDERREERVNERLRAVRLEGSR